jgi:tetratricopeptide (TPR) repeat protein
MTEVRDLIVMGKSSRKKKTTQEEIGAGQGGTKFFQKPDDPGLSQKTIPQRAQNAKYYLAASVSLLTFLVYLKSLQNEFVNWDDSLYVFENPHLHFLSPTFFRWAFFDFYAANWHPLTWMSHALDYAIWGLNPVGHHLTNNILHAANTFLVVMLTVRLLKIYRERTQLEGSATFLDDRSTLIAGGVAGLLFGLHPVHVESVAWVAERKDLLCALFFLLSIMMYMKYALGANDEGQRTERMRQRLEHKGSTPFAMRFALCADRYYLTALGFFVFALLSKPMAVSLPAVLLILDWFPLRRIQTVKSLRPALFEKLPFIALSLISSILTVLAQKSGDAIIEMKLLPLSIRLTVAAKALISYIWKMILPLNLIPYYPYPEDASFLSFGYLLSILLVLGITMLCVGILRKVKLWASVWSYYVVTLIPVLGIIQVGGQAMADRYTYLPSLGPFLVMGVLAAWVSMKADRVKKKSLKIIAPAAAIIFLFFTLIYLTIQQISVWKNNFTLWNYVIESQRREIPFVYYHRGLAFMAMGRMDRALDDINKAIALDPSDYYAYINRGLANSETGQVDKAIEDFDKAVSLNPRSYEAYNNKGMVYGKIGLFGNAIEQFNKSIDIKPNSLAYGNRGLAYSLIGDYDRALQDLNNAIELDNNDAGSYGARGNLYLKTGNSELAVSDFQKACDLRDERACNALRNLRPRIRDQDR